MESVITDTFRINTINNTRKVEENMESVICNL